MKITLCGSTRFKDAFLATNKSLSLLGHVVYSVAFFGHADVEPLTVDEKTLLDCVHMAKIEESDAVVVLNVNGYFGESTRREVKWARVRGKKVAWLEFPCESAQAGEQSMKELVQ